MDNVLLIDDDIELCSMLTDYLARHGFRITAVHRGDKGLLAIREKPWSMVLLDVMLPGLDGFEVLKRLRVTSAISVLLLTARGEEVDRIDGLEMGADDYLSKPFNPRELLARMRAILRRSGTTEHKTEPTMLTVDGLSLDAAARRARFHGRELDLTSVEFALLESLMRSPGKVVAREELAEAVLGRKFSPFDRSLDMHVSRLRKKISGEGAQDTLVKTIRGAGYQLVLPWSSAESQV